VVLGRDLFGLEELGGAESLLGDDLVAGVAFEVEAFVASFLVELLLLFGGEVLVVFFLLVEEGVFEVVLLIVVHLSSFLSKTSLFLEKFDCFLLVGFVFMVFIPCFFIS